MLVTGAGGPAGINVIKDLAGYYHVVAVDASPYSEGFILADEYYIVPLAYNPTFIDKLLAIIHSRDVDLVIPTVDEEIDVLARASENNEELSRLVSEGKLVLHPLATVSLCLDKLLLYEYLSKTMPEIVPNYSTNPRELEPKIIVRKPRRGRGGRGIAIGRREDFKPSQGFFYVEYLPGREWTVDVLTNREGESLVAVPRIRVKVRGGVSVIGKVVLNEDILNIVKQLTKTIKFTGPLNIQFKEDEQGRPKLQEINLRFSGGLDITIAAGAPLPRILVDIWTTGHSELLTIIRIREGIYYKIYNVYHARG